MPIISWKKQDLDAGKPWEPGWVKVRLVEVRETPSKDKQSINHVPYFEDVNIPGRITKDWAYTMNTKSMPLYMRNALPLMEALTGKKVDEGDGSFNWEAVYGKELWIEIVPDIFNGQPTYKIGGFADISKVPF